MRVRPRSFACSCMCGSAGEPSKWADVPAESMKNWSEIFCSETRCLRIPSPAGERQMLPMQTKRTLLRGCFSVMAIIVLYFLGGDG